VVIQKFASFVQFGDPIDDEQILFYFATYAFQFQRFSKKLRIISEKLSTLYRAMDSERVSLHDILVDFKVKNNPNAGTILTLNKVK
jgi:hypothetical protein